jgi:hypothetical protein
LGRVDGVEGAEDAKFAAVIGRGIAEHSHLDFHGRRVGGIGARRKAKGEKTSRPVTQAGLVN